MVLLISVEKTVLAFADHTLLPSSLRGYIENGSRLFVSLFVKEQQLQRKLLIHISKQVIRQIRSCGLRILSTTSDQGSIYQVTINKLLLETNTYFLSQNVENLLHEYSVDGEEIVYLYDFPPFNEMRT
jgi:hypothetical protein